MCATPMNMREHFFSADRMIDVLTLASSMQSLDVSSDSSISAAESLKKQAKTFIREITAAHKELKAPLLERTRAMDELRNTLIAPLKEGIESLNAAIEAERRARCANAANSVSEFTRSTEADPDGVPDMSHLAAIARPVEGVKTRKHLAITIEDLSKIPLEFLVPDMKAIEKAIREGRSIPGVRSAWEDRVV